MFNIVVTGCDYIHLPVGIYPSCIAMALEYLGIEYLVLGVTWLEMRSTCNLVDMQMMHRIYIKMVDVQMLIIAYNLIFMNYYDICYACAMLWCILQGHSTKSRESVILVEKNENVDFLFPFMWMHTPSFWVPKNPLSLIL